jgi:hypothetical protein
MTNPQAGLNGPEYGVRSSVRDVKLLHILPKQEQTPRIAGRRRVVDREGSDAG